MAWQELSPDHFPSMADGGGLYALYCEGQLVYVGRSTFLRTRVKEHKRWMPFDSIKILCVGDLGEQKRREARLIARLRPVLNRQIPGSQSRYL